MRSTGAAAITSVEPHGNDARANDVAHHGFGTDDD